MAWSDADADEQTLPTPQEMKVFTVLCRVRTITEAAGELGYSQSQVSRILHRLEQRLDVRLFDRAPTGLTTTLEGEAFAETCAAIRGSYSTQMRRFENLIAGDAGQLRVSVLPSMAFAHMGEWTNSFRASFPSATVTVTDDISGNSLEAVLSGDADIAISACLLRGPAGGERTLFSETAALEVVPLLEERFSLVSPPAEEPDPQPSWETAFAASQVGFTDRTSIRRCLAVIADLTGLGYHPGTLTNSPLTIAGLVEAGIGSSIVPESNLPLMRIRSLRTQQLPDFRRVICLVFRSGDNAPLVRRFASTLLELTSESHR
ncbi:LysR family transcriptional regulator [Brevibacterium limosum]|uniref:LysR family transcriptional regulator n=1 Tax=Brevibacterium limosum TaxID=2697565 RepID=UPI0014246E27|nr:LysR family transcriptional regulator [Brevibacterium limosum]